MSDRPPDGVPPAGPTYDELMSHQYDDDCVAELERELSEARNASNADAAETRRILDSIRDALGQTGDDLKRTPADYADQVRRERDAARKLLRDALACMQALVVHAHGRNRYDTRNTIARIEAELMQGDVYVSNKARLQELCDDLARRAKAGRGTAHNKGEKR